MRVAFGGRARPMIVLLPGLCGLAGCALQGPYTPPATVDDNSRLAPMAPLAPPLAPGAAWWKTLDDPAVDRLVEQALVANPDLDRAVALIAEARALAGSAAAAQSPSVTFEGGVSGESTRPASTSGGGSRTVGTAGLAVAWELDVFGRVRGEVEASRNRLDARVAEAEAVRLALIADVADGVTGLRACRTSLEALSLDIASRRTVLDLTRARREAGFDADLDVLLARTGLANAETARALRLQECDGLVNALVLLTGAEAATVLDILEAAPFQPPALPPPVRLPGAVLRSSPSVVAAERAAEAAWADIGVARAERWPRIDLTAVLTGQWLNALGTTTESGTGTAGLGLVLPIFDGGRGAAAVAGGEARYAAALADLDRALRLSARDVRNALSAAASARSRELSALDADAAAAATVRAREAQWRAGAISQFELEAARQQAFVARDSVITAGRDAARSWVALVRAAGPDLLLSESVQ
ncbi:efflux transporter outer membrane subunit [Brevundimonas sp. GCM10030266]|uniref:efflux transporter outer membrane subunit n=1 Tax=Brevundimonas sp. GCM10030266 TaxID=3273386 RepID=UPI00360EF70F